MRITWKRPVDGAFTAAADWSGGVTPGAADDAWLTAAGRAFTVTAAGVITVQGIATSANATLAITAGGRFTASRGTDGAANAGRILVLDGAHFAFAGGLDNTGAIRLVAGRDQTGLFVAAGGATLTGGGLIALGDDPNAVVTTASGAASLVNLDNTITGAGLIGGGELSLANGAAGVIDASGATLLAVDASQQLTVTNAGTIEATGAGGLALQNGVFVNTGTIADAGSGGLTLDHALVNDAGGGVLLAGASLTLEYGTIAGGGLAIGAADTLTVESGSLGDLSGASLANAGTIEVSDSAYLVVQNTIANSGVIRLGSVGLQSSLYIGKAGAILAGGGQLTLTDNPFNVITSGFSGLASLVNVDNTIAGAGIIGFNPYNGASVLTLVNDAGGVIEQLGLNGLTIDGAPHGSVVNAGLIETAGAGGLTLFKGSFGNSGLVEDAGPGQLVLDYARLIDSGAGRVLIASGELVLHNSTITGGALTIAAGAGLQVDALCVGDVSGAALANAGDITVLNSGFFAVHGAVSNSGVIALDSFLNESALYIAASGATLAGGGQVLMGDNPKNVVTGALPGLSTLTNFDNTIAGSGVIGRDIGDTAAFLAFVNDAKGVVDSTGAAGLTIDATAPGSVVNAGLIETTGAGGLTLAGGVFTNTGVIESLGAGGVTLDKAVVDDGGGGVLSVGTAALVLYGSTLTGGSLAIGGGGGLRVDGAALSDLSGTTFANAGQVSIADAAALLVQGRVDNAGVILLGAATAVTGLYIGANGATLSGGGQVRLGDSADNLIAGVSSRAVGLDNLDDTIVGAGTLSLALANGAAGLVEASGYNALVLDGAGQAAMSNAGTLAAMGAGGLLIETATIAGAGGVVLAATGATATLAAVALNGGGLEIAAGGKIALAGHAAVTVTAASANAGALMVGSGGALVLAGATLDQSGGGTLTVAGGAKLTLASATIVGGGLVGASKAKVIVEGGGNVLDGRTSALTCDAAVTVAAGGSLEVEGAIGNSGAMSLASATAATELIVQSAGLTLSGKGTISLADDPFSEITGVGPAAALINLGNTIAGSGLLGGGELQLVNRAGGVIDAAGASVGLTVNTGADTIQNAGLIEATGAAGGSLASAIANNGTLEAGGGQLTCLQAVTGTGAAVIAAGTLAFQSSFSQNVTFTGATGALLLAQSQTYAGQIAGFSTTGATSLDLADIAFGGATRASYSGTSASGILTVTDGVHKAAIALVGDYTGATFTVSSDGHGGTIVVDPRGPPTPAALAAAAAGLGAPGPGAGASAAAAAIEPRPPALARPAG